MAHLPERENLKKSMRTIRRRNLPPNPRSIDELQEVPESFRNTLTGDRFLIWDSNDSGAIEGRVLVFSTRRNVELLSQSKLWYLDGTFKVRRQTILIIYFIFFIFLLCILPCRSRHRSLRRFLPFLEVCEIVLGIDC